MPRPRKAASRPDLTPGQAAYVLNRLVKERRISSADINRYVADLGNEISALERELERLRAAHGGGSTPVEAPRRAAAAAPVRRRRGRKAGAKRAAGAGSKKQASGLTPEQQASRQLQGRYLGLVRQFPQSRRAHYSRIAKEKGREAAIKEMLDARK